MPHLTLDISWKVIFYYLGRFRTMLEMLGWLSILPVYFWLCLFYFESYGTSIISRSISPGGNIAGVVQDCWPQAGFGLQSTEQDMIVHLIRSGEEWNLDSCGYPGTAMLSTWKSDLKERPLLHWLSSDHLEVMIPEGSQITQFRTSRNGIAVTFMFENTAEQKARRQSETSAGPTDAYEQINSINWKIIDGIAGKLMLFN